MRTNGSGNTDLLQLIAEIYYRSHDYANAFPVVKKTLSAQIFDPEVRYQCILLLGMTVRDATPYVLAQNGINPARRFNEAFKNINEALTFALNNHAVALARDCYLELSTTYEMQKNYKSFHDTYKQYIVMRDSVANQGNQNALNSKLLQTQFDKQADSLKFSAQITRTRLHTKQVQSYYFIGGIIILLALSFFVYRSYKKADFEKHRSDELLLNILPADVAEELKEKGSANARLFDEVTVLFTDFVNFTTVSELLTPQELVDELNVCFKAFDGIMGHA